MSEFQLVKTVWPPGKRWQYESDGRVQPNGYLLTLAELAEAFEAHRMYPVQLAASFDTEAAALFAAWISRSKKPWNPEERPWVPVGSVGPLLILGHMDLRISVPPLPWGTFQPVCLRKDDYESQLSKSALAIDERSLSEISWRRYYGGGVARFPETLVLPTERANAVHFLIEYFLHRTSIEPLLQRAFARGDLADDQLPPSYAAVLNFLIHQGSVAQTTNVRLLESSQKHIPEIFRRKITVVTEMEGHIWCAATSLPQPEAEDRLYAELGEGWKIHWLLRAPEEIKAQPGSANGSSSSQSGGTNPPHKIVLGATSSPIARSGDAEESSEERDRVVILDEREWDRFDPRQRNAEPEAMWKWALFKAIAAQATDLHFEPGPSRGIVRQRVDGLLEEVLDVPPAVCEQMVYSLMTQVSLGEDHYRPADGSFLIQIIGKLATRNQELRVRASAYPVRGSTQKIALRILPRLGSVQALNSLIPPRAYKFISRAISRPEGLILVCGPTGSGKTTTIFSALASLNRPETNLTTLENPVEIVLQGVNQAEVNAKRRVTWEELNRAFLRQDPDIGLIGEIRDEDTCKTILRAALTGHLVFGSLHTKSCPTSVVRMIDLGANENMLAESLLIIISQRLIRKLCSCKQEYSPKSEEIALFERHRLKVPKCFHRAPANNDCEKCRGRGYVGRVAAVEVLPNVPAVQRMIEKREVSAAYAKWMADHELQTVFENALELAAEGITSVEEALTLQEAWGDVAFDSINKE